MSISVSVEGVCRKCGRYVVIREGQGQPDDCEHEIDTTGRGAEASTPSLVLRDDVVQQVRTSGGRRGL
jgi:hypothetical protein